MGKKTAVDCFY